MTGPETFIVIIALACSALFVSALIYHALKDTAAKRARRMDRASGRGQRRGFSPISDREGYW